MSRVPDELMLKLCVPCTAPHTLLAFRGRQPLWGTGLLSVMEMISKPPMVSPLMAACNETAQELSTHGTAEKGQSSEQNTFIPHLKINLFQWFSLGNSLK